MYMNFNHHYESAIIYTVYTLVYIMCTLFLYFLPQLITTIYIDQKERNIIISLFMTY
jgi:hypothetical protein